MESKLLSRKRGRRGTAGPKEIKLEFHKNFEAKRDVKSIVPLSTIDRGYLLLFSMFFFAFFNMLLMPVLMKSDNQQLLTETGGKKKNIPYSLTRTSLERNLSLQVPPDGKLRQHQAKQPHLHLNSCSVPRCQRFYTRTRQDRSGAQIFEMLTAHAYASYLGYEYGGVCGKSRYMEDYLKLTASLGLEDELIFNSASCSQIADECFIYHKLSCLRQFSWAFMSYEWKAYMRNKVYQALHLEEKSDPNFSIAVHIRRGDVTPCLEKVATRKRYDPNQHFLDIIDRYAEDGATVTIYTVKKSYEPFSVFRSRNYRLILGGSIETVWRGILQADMFVMSRSAFSLVPAVLSRGSVVFTPYPYMPHPHSDWHVVMESILNRTESLQGRLFQNCSTK